MESVAVVLLLVLLGGYFVFAGSDIGLGMLLPYAARSPAERRRLIAVIAPYFLGSEVWLVATIGVVAGLVPVWEAAVVTVQWPVFVLLLAAWLGRDAGLWLRGRLPAARWRAVWDGAVAAGSWLLAVAWGFVVAALVGGGTLRPGVTLVCVALVVLLFAVRGAAFGAERLAAAEGVGGAEPGERAARVFRVLVRAGLVVVPVAAGVLWVSAGAAPAVVVAGAEVVLAAAAVDAGRGWARVLSALGMAVLPVVLAVGAELPAPAVERNSLLLLVAAAGPLVPVMVAGQVWLYRISRRPIVGSGFFA